MPGLDDDRSVVIFDLDGLLVNTEKLFYRAVVGAARARGMHIEFGEYVSRVVSRGEDIRHVFALNSLEVEEFEHDVLQRYSRLLAAAGSEIVREGAKQCVERIASQYRVILVTNSRRVFAETIIERLGIGHWLERTITRDDPYPPKPNPEVFVRLLDELDKRKWEVVVIEDSRRGIEAATRAGIASVWVPNDYTRGEALNTPKVRLAANLADVSPELISQVLEEERRHHMRGHTLAGVYADSAERLEEVFTTYQEIYELPEFTHPDSEVCPAAFAYALRRRHFIILAMHSPKLGVYFRRSFDTGHLGMLLPGGGIHVDKHESVHSAIQRIARRELPSAKLRNVAPVALLRNVFTCVDGRKAEHLGLGIYALLTNGTDEVGDELKAIDVKGSFVQELDPAEIPQAPAALVYKKVLDRLQMQRYSPYTHEDDVQSQVKQRYALHRKFVSPLMNLLDFGRGAAAKKVARDAASNATSFLDVACGDNREIIYAARACPLVVANDISMAQINTLEQEYRQQAKTLPSSHALLFTNHDCLDLPFRENAFDFVLVRNLLHHMENAGDFRLLVTNLRLVGRRIAIVEIEDPSRGGFWPAIRHAYYSHWLREQGNNFFERSSFQDTIKDYFPRDKCEFKFSSTIRGVYMTAIIDKRR